MTKQRIWKAANMQTTMAATRANQRINSDHETEDATPHRNAILPQAARGSEGMKEEALFERVRNRLKAQVGPEIFARSS